MIFNSYVYVIHTIYSPFSDIQDSVACSHNHISRAHTFACPHFAGYIFARMSVIFTGRKPPPLSSVLYGKISKRRSVLAGQLLLTLEKNQVPRELALIAISLACLVAQWYSYGGSWKWVTILPILIGILQLLFAICFCIPSYVHQQLLSLDCQNFVPYNSLEFFTCLGNSPGAGFHFWKRTYNFQNCFRTQFV